VQRSVSRPAFERSASDDPSEVILVVLGWVGRALERTRRRCVLAFGEVVGVEEESNHYVGCCRRCVVSPFSRERASSKVRPALTHCSTEDIPEVRW
jgi:hypothetical protein